MTVITTLTILLSSVSLVYSQEQDKSEDNYNGEPFTIVEDMPVFPGGDLGLMKYLHSVPIPIELKDEEIFEVVKIRFIIDKMGQVQNAEIIQGANEVLNITALEHINRMPNWQPGKQNGKPVRVQFIVPVRFEIDEPYWKQREKMEKKEEKKVKNK